MGGQEILDFFIITFRFNYNLKTLCLYSVGFECVRDLPIIPKITNERCKNEPVVRHELEKEA